MSKEIPHNYIPFYCRIARQVERFKRLQKEKPAHWDDSHYQEMLANAREEIEACESMLPSGSGIDSGTKIDLDRSTPDKLVLIAGFHHMNENGYYDGWTDHEITIKPSLAFGFTISISGKDRNGIKEYLADTYHGDLAGYVAPFKGV